MLFKSEDLKFVKSVKRENGTGWAYYDEGMENSFILNFSDTQKKAAALIKPGELILLFQRVDKMPEVAKKTYLTHILTPKNSEFKRDDTLSHDFKWTREVFVVARANPSTAIHTIPTNLSFYKPQRGRVCDIRLLSDTKSVSEIQNEVWRLFDGHFNPDTDNFIQRNVDPIVDEVYVTEGGDIRVERSHIIRERNPIIVGIAKQRALRAGLGRLKCECCEFDFTDKYGLLGLDFIEGHHKLPLHSGIIRDTRPEDIALVCSNCHRMLHRKDKSTGDYNTIDSLKSIIDRLKKQKH